ncbi:hypothetical protein [Acidisoma sp. S159]|uniref:hypothetical protein n=1 Tax=Acidisoma sp. S159 TaxID=1747225 RepID=UPI00131A9F60|nr:hypothetical protein [Acidisoma sp. S159]
MVGPFWVVEENGKPAIVALTVPLERAETYGDMLTVETGHFEHWSRLARRGAAVLRTAGEPTAPVWSEYEEWPRGRVIFDCVARRFLIRADRHLHHPAFVRLITDCFCIEADEVTVLLDDHYRSVRRVSLPSER